MANGGDAIEVYARIRPTTRVAGQYFARNDLEGSSLSLVVPKDERGGLINNQRENYEFKFSTIFDQPTKQEEIFDRVAKKSVLHALEGYNSTIFAYGQTGSGKSFTITGGPESYADRGIIPRALSYIFSELGKRTDTQTLVLISYLEIYNDMGFDLLHPEHENNITNRLNKISMREDEAGNIHLEGLTSHVANNEEEALNVLFVGDTNRVVSETPMNPVSSRSHCIFTISLEMRTPGSDVVKRSKLNLVDLAGCERVAKTNAEGKLLREAKHINGSLFFLEQVIVALQERAEGKRDHIPYRNSMMTWVLRDSLGGNCKTIMIATLNPDADHMDETISTCRFAQRVACIKTTAQVNEEIDPHLMVRRLKKQVQELKDEISLLKGGDAEERGPITDEEKIRCQDAVNKYVDDPSPESVLSVGDIVRVRECFAIMKQMINDLRSAGGGRSAEEEHMIVHKKEKQKASASVASSVASLPPPPEPTSSFTDEQVKSLQLQLQQRDNEINILVSMLKKKKGASCEVETQTSEADSKLPATSVPVRRAHEPSSAPPQPSAPAPALPMEIPQVHPDTINITAEALLNPEVLADRNKAFEMFRKSYRKSQVLEQNKKILNEKYDEAKAIGAIVNQSKEKIMALKAHIERVRLERAKTGLINKAGGLDEMDPEEEKAREDLTRERNSCQENFAKLKALKAEIEQIQMFVEKSRAQVQKDFDQWFTIMANQRAGYTQGAMPLGQMPPQPMPGPMHSPPPPTSGGASSAAPLQPPQHPRQAWGESPERGPPSQQPTPQHRSSREDLARGPSPVPSLSRSMSGGAVLDGGPSSARGRPPQGPPPSMRPPVPGAPSPSASIDRPPRAVVSPGESSSTPLSARSRPPQDPRGMPPAPDYGRPPPPRSGAFTDQFFGQMGGGGGGGGGSSSGGPPGPRSRSTDPLAGRGMRDGAPSPRPPSAGSSPRPPSLTGDNEADNDIMAYYQARQNYLRKS